MLILGGCSMPVEFAAPPLVASGTPFSGRVMGGSQAIIGADIQLYAANNTDYAGASAKLLKAPVQSDGKGNFSILGDFTCPSANTLVYLVAIGGNPGGGKNPNSAMMTTVGPCGSLSSSTFISLNEITTVASAYALAPFMGGYGNVGVSSKNRQGLANAFATPGKLVRLDTGQAPGILPTGALAPVAELNTLADILAACVNSTGGVAGDRSTCGSLFKSTTPIGGASPTDTVAAALNIAKNPGANVPALLALVAPNAPFQPTIATAKDLSVAVKYRPALNSPGAAAIDATGNVWIIDAGNNSMVVIDSMGMPLADSPFTSGKLSGPSAVAIDANGQVWVTNRTSSSLSVFTPQGAGEERKLTGLDLPDAIAIDTQGVLWVANGGNNSVSSVVVQGTAALSSATHSLAGMQGSVAVAIGHP